MLRMNTWIKSILILGSLVLVILLSGCSCWTNLIDFKIYNNTNQNLHIYIDGETLLDDISPGEQTVWTTDRIYSDYEIIAKDDNGTILYIAQYSLDSIRGKTELDVYFPPNKDE